jgi:hypothetical protein
MSAAELRALAKRVCEEAPSRELNEAVARAAGWRYRGYGYWAPPGSSLDARQHLPQILRSLDAAASLMPRWYSWMVSHRQIDGAWVNLAQAWMPEPRSTVQGQAQDPAAALCAAALLAMAADMEASDAPR